MIILPCRFSSVPNSQSSPVPHLSPSLICQNQPNRRNLPAAGRLGPVLCILQIRNRIAFNLKTDEERRAQAEGAQGWLDGRIRSNNSRLLDSSFRPIRCRAARNCGPWTAFIKAQTSTVQRDREFASYASGNPDNVEDSIAVVPGIY